MAIPRAGSRPLGSRRPGRRSAGSGAAFRARRSGNAVWSCDRLESARSPAFAPPFSACGAAVGLHSGAIHQDLDGRTAGGGKRLENASPDAAARPADKPVVERLARPLGGASDQRQPDLNTWMIPLIIRRSSTRGPPRTSCGSRGSRRAHCASLSQNGSAISRSYLNRNRESHRLASLQPLNGSGH